MRSLRVVAFAAVLALCASAADVRLEIHLKRATSEDVIEREFDERATPGHPKFRQHLSVEELSRLVRPVAGAEIAVRSFIRTTPGASEKGMFATGDVITATVSSSTVASQRLGLNDLHFGERSVSKGVDVPKHLEAYVDYIVAAPTGLPQKPKKVRIQSANQGMFSEPGMEQTPPTLYQRYQLPMSLLPATAVQGVGEFYPMGYSDAALNKLNNEYGLPNPPMMVSGPQKGGMNGFQPFEEGPLDVQYITSLAPNATTWWIAGDANATWATMADHIMSVSPMPTVVSISWGSPESSFLNQGAPITGIPSPLVTANDAFRKLGLLGVTVLASAGDNGAATWNQNDCSRYGPNYPASSPYVTSVGATYANAQNEPEQAVYFSGGGFSDFFTAPSWQTSQVQAYLQQSGIPPANLFNTSGRGYPDVSALGTNFKVAIDEFGSLPYTTVSGTSASAPAFAGVLTRVNADRAASGKSSLGFLNKAIYALNKVGQDITMGASQNGCPSNNGFPATQGWDAVTGLGTPSYPYLIANL